MTARVMTRLTLKTVTPIDICSMFILFGLVFCIFNLNLKNKKQPNQTDECCDILFSDKYSLYFIIVLNAEKLTYSI